MATSAAKSVDQYLSELPQDRRAIVSSVRDLILTHLPAGYSEAMNWGMICYEIPLARYPDTYNGQPLAYVALASQKKHIGLYLMSIAVQPEQRAQLKAGFTEAGKRLDVGLSCIRFKTLDDLAMPALGRAIASMPPDAYIRQYEESRRASTARPRAKATTKTKAPATRAAKSKRKNAAKPSKKAAKPPRANAKARKKATTTRAATARRRS